MIRTIASIRGFCHAKDRCFTLAPGKLNRRLKMYSSRTTKDDSQPETRPISQEQLVAEVKGIYAGLLMVEAKCIEVDNRQAALAQADGAGSLPPRRS